MSLSLFACLLFVSASHPAPTVVPGHALVERGTARAAAGEQDSDLAPEGWAALERGDASKAAAIFREALDRSPYNAPLHFGAGYAAYLLGRLDASIPALKKALEIERGSFRPRHCSPKWPRPRRSPARDSIDGKGGGAHSAGSTRSEQLARWKQNRPCNDSFDELMMFASG